MIYVTHDQVEAMTLASRIVVLRAGRIEQIGAPMELYENPDNVFVAGFIGSPRINFVSAILHSAGNGRAVLENAALGLQGLSVALRGSHAKEGARIRLGIRPEHFLPPGIQARRWKAGSPLSSGLAGWPTSMRHWPTEPRSPSKAAMAAPSKPANSNGLPSTRTALSCLARTRSGFSRLR
jgi:ABC-type Fe3+/spermidine/putrescine transport system ATPase subunit